MTRTCDPVINSHLLCQLSYWGMTGARILRSSPLRVNGLRARSRDGGGWDPGAFCYGRSVASILGESAARQHFAALVARPEVPLAEAALAIAEEEYPGLQAADYLARLDALGAEVRQALGEKHDPASVLRALRQVLAVGEKFRGNAEAYYDPRNSFLNQVLERRLGIPITLGVLYIEVAARAGLHLDGVGFPGHFLVKYAGSGGREIFVDPFHGGEILSADDCLARFRERAPGLTLEALHLAAVGARQILGRMLHNLKKIYVEAGDDVRALWVVDRLLILAPDDLSERRDRGLVEARLGGAGAALADLEAYLAATPDAPDADEVRSLAAQLRQRGSMLN
jgi:regulator of sirC expression with transglutaminase-like and TPR domain